MSEREDPLLKVPPASRGNLTCAVPLAKRGEPAGGGQIENSERTIGITLLPHNTALKTRRETTSEKPRNLPQDCPVKVPVEESYGLFTLT